MPVNLLNEKDLNAYLADLVYQGQTNALSALTDLQNRLKDANFVMQNKDAITKAILLQWTKHRLRAYLTAEEVMPFLTPVTNGKNLPAWTQKCLSENKKVFEFNPLHITPSLKDDIIVVRDFLYSVAEKYVVQTAKGALKTNKNPKVRLDYLKTNNEYASFDKVLAQSGKWHQLMAKCTEKKSQNKMLLEKSLKGSQFVMNLPNSMSAYRLTTPEALDFESEYMGHCVGQGAYDVNVKNGSVEIYSLRDARGEPHATLEVRGSNVYQCKGKGNKPPVQKYIPAIQTLIEAKGLNVIDDVKNTGLLKQDGKYYNIWDLPAGFVVNGDLDLSKMNLSELPNLTDVIVEGNFYCFGNKLKTLKGAPKRVNGSFECSHNELENLQGAPTYVGGSFGCAVNKLSSLEGAPRYVQDSFYCYRNELCDLLGAPAEINGTFECSRNHLVHLSGAPRSVGENFVCCENDLTDLMGGPEKVGGNYDCSQNKLRTLAGAAQNVGDRFNCSQNELVSLKGAPHRLAGSFYCDQNKLVNLVGAPQYVGGTFSCSKNNLTSLEGAPVEIGINFRCSQDLDLLKGNLGLQHSLCKLKGR